MKNKFQYIEKQKIKIRRLNIFMTILIHYRKLIYFFFTHKTDISSLINNEINQMEIYSSAEIYNRKKETHVLKIFLINNGHNMILVSSLKHVCGGYFLTM